MASGQGSLSAKKAHAVAVEERWRRAIAARRGCPLGLGFDAATEIGQVLKTFEEIAMLEPTPLSRAQCGAATVDEWRR